MLSSLILVYILGMGLKIIAASAVKTMLHIKLIIHSQLLSEEACLI